MQLSGSDYTVFNDKMFSKSWIGKNMEKMVKT